MKFQWLLFLWSWTICSSFLQSFYGPRREDGKEGPTCSLCFDHWSIRATKVPQGRKRTICMSVKKECMGRGCEGIHVCKHLRKQRRRMGTNEVDWSTTRLTSLHRWGGEQQVMTNQGNCGHRQDWASAKLLPSRPEWLKVASGRAGSSIGKRQFRLFPWRIAFRW